MSASRSTASGRAGERVAEPTGANEVILVMVEGKAGITVAGRDWVALSKRMDVFEKTPPHYLYVPNGQDWAAVAETDCTIAVCAAPGRGGHEARRIGPDGITLTARGKGTNTRHINNIAMEAEDWCDPLLVTEVFTPAGHWSSYPSLNIPRTERFVMVEVVSRPRPREAKLAFYENQSGDVLARCGVEASDVMVAFTQNTDEDWSFGNGRAQFVTGEL